MNAAQKKWFDLARECDLAPSPIAGLVLSPGCVGFEVTLSSGHRAVYEVDPDGELTQLA